MLCVMLCIGIQAHPGVSKNLISLSISHCAFESIESIDSTQLTRTCLGSSCLSTRAWHPGSLTCVQHSHHSKHSQHSHVHGYTGYMGGVHGRPGCAFPCGSPTLCGLCHICISAGAHSSWHAVQLGSRVSVNAHRYRHCPTYTSHHTSQRTRK